MDIRLADATSLPLDDKCADLVVAFMSLHDIDAMPATVKDVARILVPGGRFCLAIVHPINSCGRFEASTADARFVISGDYLRPFRYSDTVERDGLSMTFHSQIGQSRPILSRWRRLVCWSKRCASRAFPINPSFRQRDSAGRGYRYSCTCELAGHR